MIRDVLAKEVTGVVVVNSSMVLGMCATMASFFHFGLSASCCPVRQSRFSSAGAGQISRVGSKSYVRSEQRSSLAMY